MHLRPLEDEADPARRAHIGVIEELAQCREQRVNCAARRVQSQNPVDQHTADEGIDGHLDRVFVERRDDFEPRRAVVDLVET